MYYIVTQLVNNVKRDYISPTPRLCGERSESVNSRLGLPYLNELLLSEEQQD
jgi:hypothetical protein